ncbi:extensin family protein [Rouxiella chamberiensis]|uniref:Extensin family protein n=1 Tax=Rouxiella chamberiensis TaxID=1513468 RepID=A0ABY7HVK6_9GAMM|nr:extensin family protein [Rouxiella chamberiensis]WAT02821.1 extensin family protein [Rouxiella chamberiensis]
MRYILFALVVLVAGFAVYPWLQSQLPPQYNPFTPLSVSDPPGLITQYKLKRLSKNPAACLAVLERAKADGLLNFQSVGNTRGQCPLTDAVRVQNFGKVSLSSSFLASCPLAVSTTMFVAQAAAPVAERVMNQRLIRIDHLGSFACRNVYHRAEGRISEHATADALDVSGFRMTGGENVTVAGGWKREDKTSTFLHDVFSEGCPFFGNIIGPDYNAAHANHFHLGMRWFGFCR